MRQKYIVMTLMIMIMLSFQVVVVRSVQGILTNNDESRKGSIKGQVIFEGVPPERQRFDVSASPFCKKRNSHGVLAEDTVIGENGGLAHVFLYLDKPGGYSPGAKEPVVLDLKDCRFRPHVFGLVEGQTLRIRNQDKVFHNIHCYRGDMACFNQALFQKAAPVEQEFEEDGIVRFVSDVHPWMVAYALVRLNPFFATTGEDGTYEIKDVPPGEYTLTAWHERFGEQQIKVTVTAGAAAVQNFKFRTGS